MRLSTPKFSTPNCIPSALKAPPDEEVSPPAATPVLRRPFSVPLPAPTYPPDPPLPEILGSSFAFTLTWPASLSTGN